MGRSVVQRTGIAALLASMILVAPAAAAPCGNGPAGFDTWKAAFKEEAVRAGISRGTVNGAIDPVQYSRRVVSLDRNQKSFRLSFDQFWARRTSNAMIRRGRDYIANNRGMFDRIEQRFGVPAPLLVSVWALETGFGRDMGSLPIIQSLATLAYDCRRSDFFTRELLAALRILDRGDMRASEMRGAWAGEIGQTQFLAERYLNYAVDFDGDGRRDLMRSVPDALASTANWFARNGWRRGQPWGPGTANYNVIAKWNRASVYQRTIAQLADELAR